jgi:hypothetical protein
MQGHPPFSKSITLYFRAHLAPLLAGNRWAVVYVNNPRLRGFFRFEKPFESAFLVVNTEGDAANPIRDVSTNLTPAKALEYVACALGSRDIPVTLDNVMHWEAAAQVATSFQTDRVFIAGDAAHVMPPTGGFGGNTGVQDAHNLAWKLACVLHGQATPQLLTTYADERRPAATLAAEQAYTRYVLRTDPSLGTAECQPLVHDLNIELGYVYRSSAVATEDADDGVSHTSPRESRGRPGTRAPHIWLSRNGERVSTIDLYDGRFVVLCGPEARTWRECARAVAARSTTPLELRQPGQEGLEDPTGNLASSHGIEPDGCVLIRPDGFIAWRARTAENASAQRLGAALTSCLGH